MNKAIFQKDIHLTLSDNTQTTTTLENILEESPYTLLYFYPKDNTPGCTTQAQDYTELKKEFENLGIRIVGCSKDSHDSHTKFQIKCALGIPLIADTESELMNHYGIIGEKKNYGKIYMGVIRSVLLFNQKWEIIHEWRNVRAKGNAAKILKEVQEML